MNIFMISEKKRQSDSLKNIAFRYWKILIKSVMQFNVRPRITEGYIALHNIELPSIALHKVILHNIQFVLPDRCFCLLGPASSIWRGNLEHTEIRKKFVSTHDLQINAGNTCLATEVCDTDFFHTEIRIGIFENGIPSHKYRYEKL